MYRSHSSIPHDILHGLNLSANISTMLAYLSYFPPPPPVIPGPPPQRSWTCSAHSLSSSPSCLISDDLNPPSLRQYVPLISNNQSFLSINTTPIPKMTHENANSSSIFDFFQNQLTFILLLILFLSIFIFVILLLLLFLYIKRIRQRQLTSNSHIENNNNNNFELNNNKNKTFYYRLIPYRGKHSTQTTVTNPIDGNNLLRLSNHDSPVFEVKDFSKAIGVHMNNNEEQEEAL